MAGRRPKKPKKSIRKPKAKSGAFERAVALTQSGARAEAIELFQTIQGSAPNYALAQYNAGVLQLGAGLNEQAAVAFDNASKSNPNAVETWMALGQSLSKLDRFAEAIVAYRKAVTLDPTNHLAWLRLSDSLRFDEQYDECLIAGSRAAELAPDSDRVLGNHLYNKMRACDWQGIDLLRDRVAEIVLSLPDGKIPELRPFLGVVSLSQPAAQRLIADAEAHRTRRKATPALLRPEIKERLSIGYLSAGFRAHPTGYLTSALFKAHDTKRFRVVGLSLTGDDDSNVRRRIVAGCDSFLELGHLSDDHAADAIAAANIDVLVDLHGFLQGHRAGIVARRPAPVIVNYLGFPGTTGTGLHDYIIADEIIAPPENARHFSEKIVRIGGGYQFNDPIDFVEPAQRANRVDLGLGNGPIFCCFNMSYKIDPNAFDAWAEILAAVPDAQLWLLDGGPTVTRNLKREAAERGISEGQLVFGAPMRRDLHINRLTAADVGLDPWICGGHTSTTDCLFAGVPVVTRLGESFAGRVAASLMTNAGLPECVTRDSAGYVQTAIDLARDLPRTARMRRHLLTEGRRQPLFNVGLKVRLFEAAYDAMIKRHRAGQRPASFSVSS